MNKIILILSAVILAFNLTFSRQDCLAQWKKCSGVLSNSNFSYFCVKGNKIFVGTNQGINRSLDLGKSWYLITDRKFSSLAILNNNLYAGELGVFKSSNDGTIWTRIFNKTWVTNLYVSGNTILALTGADWSDEYAIYLSTNNGNSWNGNFFKTRINGFNISSNEIMFWSVPHPFHGGSLALIYSSNCGLNWESIPIGNIDFSLDGIVSEIDYILLTGWYDGVYKTTDKGIHWVHITTGKRFTKLINLKGNIVAAVSSGGVMISSDRGLTWKDWNDGFGQLPQITDFIISDEYIFGKTYDGVYIRTSKTNLNLISSEVPKYFSLHQNTPNPFNASTNFKFDIRKPDFVKLAIYDITGREVEVIVSERLEPGTYLAYWNASKYTSGVYLCRMKAGDYTDTKKMLLVK